MVWRVIRDSDGTRQGGNEVPVPQDCQARAEGIAQPSQPQQQSEDNH